MFLDRRCFANACGVLLLLLAAGCATVESAPATHDPVAFYLSDYGYHSSLVFPLDPHRYVEYSYGDWGFTALGRHHANDALGALFISSSASLGRRLIPADPQNHDPILPEPMPESFTRLYADRTIVRQRVQALESRFQSDLKSARSDADIGYTADNGMTYVKDPQHYGIGNNCNDLTAQSLSALRYTVKGWAVLSDFRFAPTSHAVAINLSTQPALKPISVPSTAPANASP